MKSILICIVSVLLFSCSLKKTIFGVYENEKGEKVTIDCGYKIYSEQLTGEFMPENGDNVTLIQNKIGDNELELAFTMDMKDTKLISTFGKWNKNSDELIINNVSYVKKKETFCKDDK